MGWCWIKMHSAGWNNGMKHKPFLYIILLLLIIILNMSCADKSESQILDEKIEDINIVEKTVYIKEKIGEETREKIKKEIIQDIMAEQRELIMEIAEKIVEEKLHNVIPLIKNEIKQEAKEELREEIIQEIISRIETIMAKEGQSKLFRLTDIINELKGNNY